MTDNNPDGAAFADASENQMQEGVTMDRYLVWSNEHGLWWRNNRSGYTLDVRDAGRYGREEAISLCRARDRTPGGRPPELPIREDDVLRIAWNPSGERGGLK